MSLSLDSKGPFVVVQPELARILGLNASIVLRRLHERSKHLQAVQVEGRHWTEGGMSEWCAAFTWMNPAKIRRVLANDLEGIVEFSPDRKRFSIDYEELQRRIADAAAPKGETGGGHATS